jgi:hypothetical protein
MPSILERLELLERAIMDIVARLEAIEAQLSTPSPPSARGQDVDSVDSPRGQGVDSARRRYKTEWQRNKRAKSKLSAKANDVADVSTNVSTGVSTGVSTPVHCGQAVVPSALPPHTQSLLFKEMEFEEEKKKEEERVCARARGTRMFADAVLSDDARLMARQLGADDWNIERWWGEFVDYWIGVPGARGVKLDWSATWRNCVRRNLERNGRGYGKQTETLDQQIQRLADACREREQELERGVFRTPRNVASG